MEARGHAATRPRFAEEGFGMLFERMGAILEGPFAAAAAPAPGVPGPRAPDRW